MAKRGEELPGISRLIGFEKQKLEPGSGEALGNAKDGQRQMHRANMLVWRMGADRRDAYLRGMS